MKALVSAMAVAALLVMSLPAWASPYAVEVVDYAGNFGPSPYNDPQALLGKPSTVFKNGDFMGLSGTGRVKLVEPAWNRDPDGNTLITTLANGDHITVKFDHHVMDDPDNPYGLDFLVFGNAFYTGAGFVSDYTNMESYFLTGGGWFEEVTVSVSQNGTDWYEYSNGPYGDTAFPTQAYEWDAEANRWTDQEMDFTKPVDPSLAETLNGGGITAEQAITMYNGSGGGTGFDLAESGYEWIQYIRVQGLGGGGEIDAFADVSPVPVPSAFWLLGGGLAALAGFRRKQG